MKIYLDMDGVLAEFDSKFKEITGIKEHLTEEAFNARWDFFIQEAGFVKLEKHETCDKLLDYVKSMNKVSVEILTSVGGAKHEMEVMSQKKRWLEKYGIWYKPNFVINRREKAEYAGKWNVLIDDHPENIEQFNEAGGIGILHVDNETTLNILEMYYLLWQKTQ